MPCVARAGFGTAPGAPSLLYSMREARSSQRRSLSRSGLKEMHRNVSIPPPGTSPLVPLLLLRLVVVSRRARGVRRDVGLVFFPHPEELLLLLGDELALVDPVESTR